MTPPDLEEYDDPDLTSDTARTLRTIAKVMGVIAGLLFFIAFGIGLTQRGEMNVPYLAFGILFSLFPLLIRKRSRSDP